MSAKENLEDKSVKDSSSLCIKIDDNPESISSKYDKRRNGQMKKLYEGRLEEELRYYAISYYSVFLK